MSPEAAELMAFAEHKLDSARKILAIELYDSAGREAYLAALSAARAIIVNIGRIKPKTHTGTRTVFAELLRNGLEFDQRLAKFLADGFEIKSTADYAGGAPVDANDAQDAIAQASAFLTAARSVLAP